MIVYKASASAEAFCCIYEKCYFYLEMLSEYRYTVSEKFCEAETSRKRKDYHLWTKPK